MTRPGPLRRRRARGTILPMPARPKAEVLRAARARILARHDGDREAARAELREAERVVSALYRRSGNQRASAGDLDVTPVTLAGRLERWGIAEDAAHLRAAGGVRGKRPGVETPDAKQVLEALDARDWRSKNGEALVAAADDLGVSKRTLQRLMQRYATIDALAERRRVALVAALEATEGNKQAAGRLIRLPGYPDGITHTTVDYWIEELGIDVSRFWKPR